MMRRERVFEFDGLSRFSASADGDSPSHFMKEIWKIIDTGADGNERF